MRERRQHCRVSGAMVSDVRVRVRPGHDATLLNASQRGVLIEVRRPIAPGVSVDVSFSFAGAHSAVRALVLRCSVRSIAALDGVTYQAALLLDETCDFGRERDSQDGYLVPVTAYAGGLEDGSQLPENKPRLATFSKEIAE